MESSTDELQCCGRSVKSCLAFATTLLLGKAPGVMVTRDTVPCLFCFKGKSLKIHHRYSSLPFKRWWGWTHRSWVACQVCLGQCQEWAFLFLFCHLLNFRRTGRQLLRQFKTLDWFWPWLLAVGFVVIVIVNISFLTSRNLQDRFKVSVMWGDT